MFRKKSSLGLFLILMAAGLFTASPLSIPQATAQSGLSEDIERENTDINRMFTKLGRGVVNVFTGWIEIPKTIAKEWARTEPFTGTVMGFAKGIPFAFARTFAGFYEVISFPLPVPRNYEPIMQPEYVLPTVWGERLPLFQDEFTGVKNTTDSAIDYGRSSTPTTGRGATTGTTTPSGTRSY